MKFLKLLISIALIISLVVDPALVRLVYAQEISPTETSTPQVIDTTTVLPLDTPIPTQAPVLNENVSVVDNVATASAVTGENTISGQSDTSNLDTGDAGTETVLVSKVNVNLVSPTLVPEPTPSIAEELTQEVQQQPTTLSDAEPSVSPSPSPSPAVENTNVALLDNTATSVSDTGDNSIFGADSASIETGQSDALVDVINVVNVNSVSSNLEVQSLEAGESGQDLTLNETWAQIGTSVPETLSPSAGVENQNAAFVVNDILAVSESGQNEISGAENASINTGDANSLVSLVNLVNLNALNSNLFIGVLNIIDPLTGDLILPGPEDFWAGSELATASGIGENQNTALVETTADVLANTGGNTETSTDGSNTIQTGNANAQTAGYSLVNLDIYGVNMFFLLVNKFADWSGNILDWSGGGSVIIQTDESAIYETASVTSTQEGVLPEGTFENQNTAVVKNNILAISDTGGNKIEGAGGNSDIKTGNANSFASIFNLVNLNVNRSNVFIGIVNIFTDWDGDIVFAYPDVSAGVNSMQSDVNVGGEAGYELRYENSGEDPAENVLVEFTLPEGTEYVDDTSGVAVQISGNNLSWNMGSLAPGENGSFSVTIRVLEEFGNSEISFWSFLVKEAKAAGPEDLGNLVVNVSIKTSDPESDTKNNSASASTVVHYPGENSGGSDPRQPVLEITAKNNVNDFVYPGDTVSFEIKVTNKSDVPSFNTVLKQNLYDGVPESFGEVSFDLGTLEPGKSGTLRFGLQLSDGYLEEGDYHTVAQAFGKAPNGNDVSSNEANTFFDIKFKLPASIVKEVSASTEPEVLGEADISCPKPEESDEDILPYVLLLTMSTKYLSDWMRKKLKVKTK